MRTPSPSSPIATSAATADDDDRRIAASAAASASGASVAAVRGPVTMRGAPAAAATAASRAADSRSDDGGFGGRSGVPTISLSRAALRTEGGTSVVCMRPHSVAARSPAAALAAAVAALGAARGSQSPPQPCASAPPHVSGLHDKARPASMAAAGVIALLRCRCLAPGARLCSESTTKSSSGRSDDGPLSSRSSAHATTPTPPPLPLPPPPPPASAASSSAAMPSIQDGGDDVTASTWS
mmetsp:Transcript_2626/g.9102  ORF Transcript_2626/g.9102 Transcript_2626/m.9102 type:complete len:239 (-) Transcript_2626:538-1254(-)